MDWARVRTLLLVVEVLSPGTARQDRFAKRQRYQEAGVPLYWLVNEEGRSVERWTPEMKFPEIVRDWLVWQPAGARTAFVLPLEELFRPL
jgi:Uma2 family endonuclease